MTELDPRLLRIGIQVDDRLKIYENLAVTVSGTKYANATQSECRVDISNLDHGTRDYLLTETSPFNANKTPKKLVVDAGRQSWGTARMFVGDIVQATPSQPPDIALTLRALTGNAQKGKVVSRGKSATRTLKSIAADIAADLGLTLDFQAKDRQVANYSFTGGALKQVNRLEDVGGINVFVSGTTLVVKDDNVPLADRLRILSADSGMIGIPKLTEQGIQVSFLYDGIVDIGWALRIKSDIYPSANGDYCIYKLGFDLSSHGTSFYFNADAKRI